MFSTQQSSFKISNPLPQSLEQPFRKDNPLVDYEIQTNEAAGGFFKWHWKESKAEIYAEFHHNDAKQNLRDLLLDTNHARAFTLGLKKVISNNSNNNFLLSWEWTKLEQTCHLD